MFPHYLFFLIFSIFLFCTMKKQEILQTYYLSSLVKDMIMLLVILSLYIDRVEIGS